MSLILTVISTVFEHFLFQVLPGVFEYDVYAELTMVAVFVIFNISQFLAVESSTLIFFRSALLTDEIEHGAERGMQDYSEVREYLY